MTAFSNFVKPRKDNKEKRLQCTENTAFNYDPPFKGRCHGGLQGFFLLGLNLR